MPRIASIQTNFTAGELSKDILGRVDIDKYQNGAELLENFMVQPHGGIMRRSGTRFVKEIKDSSAKPRLLPFEFNVTQAYIIEAGNNYIRFYKDQGSILEANQTITAATKASVIVITINGHSFSNGDEIFVSNLGGMVELSGYYLVADKTTNTFELTDVDGTDINSTNFTTYTSGGTAARVYTVTTTYTTAQLSAIQFAQSADVMYLCHEDHPPRKLTRTDHAAWTLTNIDFTDGPYVDENVTTTTLTPASASGADIVVTASAVTGINDGDGFKSTDVGRLLSIGHQADDWAASTAYAVGVVKANSNNVYECIRAGTSDGSGGPSGEGDEIKDNTCTWKFVADGGIQWGYGKISTFTDTTHVKIDISRNFGATSAETKWRLGAWSSTTGYPSSVAFFEQRLYMAGSSFQPQTLWGSKSGDYENFTPGTLDDEPVTYTIATDQVNVIRWLSPGKVMAIGTAGGEFLIGGSSNNDAITPTNVKIVREGTRGSPQTRPIRIDNVVLFIQRQLRKLREFTYQFESDSYQSPDLTILSDQVAKGGLVEIAYQQELSTIVWAVRNDGQLPGLTYLRDQKVVAWHRHLIGGSFGETSNGIVEAIAVIPGTGEDELWMCCKRTINGVTRRYVEFMEKQFDIDEAQTKEDAFFVDSGLTLDIPLTITGATAASPVVISSSGHGLENGDLVDITNVLGMVELNGSRFTVSEKTTNAFKLSGINGTGFTAYQSGGEARKAVTSISGLDHLEGETVQVLGNGAVRANAVVTNGAITGISPAASKVQVGLGYSSTLRTLRPEVRAASIGTAQGRTKRVFEVTFRFVDTLGAKYGPTIDKLISIPFRSGSDPQDSSPPLFNGDKTVQFPGGWGQDGQIVLRQDQPLPMYCTGVVTRLTLNDG